MLTNEKTKVIIYNMNDREYRGQRIDNGEWIEGFYIETGTEYHGGGRSLIGTNGTCMDYAGLQFVRVDPSTVGRYTGLTDKNGTKIFCGDIVRTDIIQDCHVEYWENGWYAYVLVGEIKRFEGYLADYDNYEVIGNIHEEVQE